MLICHMTKREPPARGRLLVSAALTAGSVVACSSEQPLPGNPKGSYYDDGLATASASTTPPETPPGDPKSSTDVATTATVAASATGKSPP